MNYCLKCKKLFSGAGTPVQIHDFVVAERMCQDCGANGGNRMSVREYRSFAGYTGQLVGGPDDGNVVTSKNTVFAFTVQYWRWLDGNKKDPSVVTIKGHYIWDESKGIFNWRPE